MTAPKESACDVIARAIRSVCSDGNADARRVAEEVERSLIAAGYPIQFEGARDYNDDYVIPPRNMGLIDTILTSSEGRRAPASPRQPTVAEPASQEHGYTPQFLDACRKWKEACRRPAYPRQEREALDHAAFKLFHEYEDRLAIAELPCDPVEHMKDALIAAGYVTPSAHTAALRERWEAGRDAGIKEAVEALKAHVASITTPEAAP
jgi:hypothetical protein